MIITISREFGSGGRELGKRLSDELHIPCYDNEIIEMISKERSLYGHSPLRCHLRDYRCRQRREQ